MRSSGSVLIVVLGLLAILAVVGITFVTMSNIDRQTAANFALQSQFMLAADGAVDYVCHHLIQDLWYYDLNAQAYQYQPGGGAGGGAAPGVALLLTDQNTQPGQELARNEPFDYPSSRYDPWLSSPPVYTAGEGLSIPPAGHFSYGEKGGTHYGLTCWGYPGTPPGERPNNLGWPDTDGNVRPYTLGNGHGVWNPDLSSPFDVGLIRVSVTVLDHAGLVNLNVHARSDDSINNAQDGCPRYGYFTSDLDLSQDPFRFLNLTKFFDGGASVPGLWSQPSHPYNDHQFEIVIENPGRYGDHPFTLDEEFELRRLTGTYFRSRLERFAGNRLDADPDSVTPARQARNRASLTTVSWTSEVRPDWESAAGQVRKARTYLPDRTQGQGYTDWSARKLDLNLDPIDDLKRAMTTGYVFDDGDANTTQVRNQLLANIQAFRNGWTAGGAAGDEDPIQAVEDTQKVGAAPQPMFSKIKVTKESQEKNQDDEIESTTWGVEVQIISPWRGNVYGDTQGLSVGNVTLSAVPAAGGAAITFDPSFPQAARMSANPESGTPWVHKAKVTVPGDVPVTTGLQRIELRAAGVVIDRLGIDVLGNPSLDGGGAMHRKIAHTFERRGPDPQAIDVVFIGEWLDGDGGSMSNFTFAAPPAPGAAVPVRFPRSVKVSTAKADTATRTRQVKGMRPYPPSGAAGQAASFRAFARVADLNQVLCPTRDDYNNLQPGEDGFWPWVPRVAAASQAGATPATEERLKFNWNDSEPTPGTYSRMNAANVFCVGGPWLDGLDNDGDGTTDEDGYAGEPADEGKSPEPNAAPGASPDVMGRFGGPELRVAGKINLNTATEDTLGAMARSFDLDERFLKDWVVTARNQQPLRTPWQFLKTHADAVDAALDNREEAKGPVEQRDLPYTLISNIATVRGDTFSIYGTIEYGLFQGTPPATTLQVVRRRRFWALVDRSPCLAYPPGQLGGDHDFIRPRILNFQWLD